MNNSRERPGAQLKICVLLFVLALAPRTYLLVHRNFGFPPQWGGETASVAFSLAHGYGFGNIYWESTGPTAAIPPVYASLMAAGIRFMGFTPALGIALMLSNAFFSAAISPLIYLVARI